MSQFFISGCQRSGTTLLRLILESHVAIKCFDEEVGYALLIRDARGEIDRAQINAVKLFGYKIPRFAEQLTRPIFYDPDYGAFQSFYRGEKVIHIVRDPADVIASMMTLRVGGNASWIDRYGREILHWMVARAETDNVYKEKYAEIESKGFPAHMVGALYWEIKNQGLFDLLKNGMPVFPVKYEKLVASPRAELLTLCRFLEVEWCDALLEHPSYPHTELDENGRAIGQTNPMRSIDTLSIGGHRRLMTQEQVNEVNTFVSDMIFGIESVLGQ
jgi:hypothetical protein